MWYGVLISSAIESTLRGLAQSKAGRADLYLYGCLRSISGVGFYEVSQVLQPSFTRERDGTDTLFVT